MADTDLIRRMLAMERRLGILEVADAPSVVARCATDAGQVIANGTPVIVNYDTVLLDGLSLVTTGASWKFTAPIGGVYLVSSFVELEYSSAPVGSVFYLDVYTDGTIYSRISHYHRNSAGGDSDTALWGSDFIELSKDSYLDLRITHNVSLSTVSLVATEEYNHIAIQLADRSL